MKVKYILLTIQLLGLDLDLHVGCHRPVQSSVERYMMYVGQGEPYKHTPKLFRMQKGFQIKMKQNGFNDHPTHL